MRWGSLLLAMMLFDGSARAAPDCPVGDDMRGQAECIHDQMSPQVIDRLYRLALSAVNGKLDPDDVPADFLYIAEEAGEAARRKGPKPLLQMASSGEASKTVFAARAITAYMDAVHHGYSHRSRFDGKGDAGLYADAKRILRPSCKRLAAHSSRFIRAEGDRCLREIDPVPPLPDADLTGFGAVPLSSGRGGLAGSKAGAIDAAPPSVRAPRTSAASPKTGPQTPGTKTR